VTCHQTFYCGFSRIAATKTSVISTTIWMKRNNHFHPLSTPVHFGGQLWTHRSLTRLCSRNIRDALDIWVFTDKSLQQIARVLWSLNYISVFWKKCNFFKIWVILCFSVVLLYFFIYFFLPPLFPSYRSTDSHEIWHECVLLCRVLDAISKFGK